MADLPPFYPPITDPETVGSLWSRYGPVRATEIIAGRDIDTAKDIQAWRSLGARQWQARQLSTDLRLITGADKT